MQLVNEVKFDRIMDQQAGGVTEVNTSIIDTANYNGVNFCVILGNVVDNARIDVQCQGNNIESDIGMVNLNGAVASIESASGDANKIIILDVYKPMKRFIRLRIARTVQNSQIQAVIATKYEPRLKPIDQSGVKVSKTFISPEATI